MLQTVDSLVSSRLLQSKMDVPNLKKALLEEVVIDLPRHPQTSNRLDARVYSLIYAIGAVIALTIPKARLSPKSVPIFDENCKKTQIKARRRKKI